MFYKSTSFSIVVALRIESENPAARSASLIIVDVMTEAWKLRDAMLNKEDGQGRVRIEYTRLDREAACILSDGLKKTRTLKKLEILGSFIHSEDCTEEDGIRVDPLIILTEGLCQNTSLEEFVLSHCDLCDADIGRIFNALIDHPTLQSLKHVGNSCGVLSLKILGCLLSSPKCQLRSLGFSDNKRNADALVAAIGGHHSLQKLSLSANNFDQADFDKILLALSKCPPTLEYLDMSRNDITMNLSDLLIVLSKFPCLLEVDMRLNRIAKLGFLENKEFLPWAYARASCKLRRLNLDFNPILRLFGTSDYDIICLVAYLNSARELGFLGSGFEESKINSPWLGHLLDMNRCGRILFQDEYRQISVALWPEVLARANEIFKNDLKRQSNAVMHLSEVLLTQLGGL